MSILFEPYTQAQGLASLELTGIGREAGEGGLAQLRLTVSGSGTQEQTGGGGGQLVLRTLGSDMSGFGFARVPLTAYGDDARSDVEPPDIALGAASFVLHGTGTGTQAQTGTGQASLPLSGWGTDLDGLGRASLPLRTLGFDSGGNARTATLVQSTGFFASMVLGDTVQYRDGLAVHDDAHPDWVMVRRALMGLHADRTARLEGLTAHTDTLTLGDVKGLVWNVLVNEGLALGEQADAWAETLIQAVDALTLTAGAESLLDSRDVVADTLALMDAAARAWPSSIREVLAMAEMATHGLHGAQTLLDVLRLHAVADGHADMVALVDERLALDETVSSTADLLARIREGAEVLATFRLPGDTTYTAWVLHGAARAYTQYRNFPFNSFCEMDGCYYGASDTGLYELTGDDDAGAPIDAHIRSGLDDLGTGKLKRVPAMYLGYRADGGLVMKVVTTSDGGEKREDWYAVQPRPADAVREGRVKLGKGLKSRYWGFELSNVDGADFEIDAIAWLPMATERRI